MTKIQNPIVPLATSSIEIDTVVFDIQTKLDTKLNWLTNAYGRAYRHIKRKDNKLMYFPEVYIGADKGISSYYRVTPDNDKKGTCFFVIDKEQNDFNENQYNFLTHNVGIVFWVNLKLINENLLDTEIFTQNLISEVRNVLTREMLGTNYKLKIDEVVREFKEVYKEFSINEDENYMLAPFQAFRFNCTVTYREDCVGTLVSSCDTLQQNISQNEILNCLIPTLNFQDNTVFNSLSIQQKMDIQTQLGF